VISISEQIDGIQSKITFIKELVELPKVIAAPDAMIVSNSHLATLLVKIENFDEAKEVLDKTRKALNDINTSDSGVYSSFYYACTEFNRVKGNPEEYYNNALQYLEYTDITALEPTVKVDFAYKFGLSALIGKENYNFGELLEHPIIEALHGSQYEWLGEALSIFNNGSIPDWQIFQEKFKDTLNSVPELVGNIPLLEQKIAIMSIITLFFGLESVERIVPLSSISARIGKDEEKVEMLLMRCMSLGFIKGQIDQVTGFVEVEWVQPRVLNVDQISLMGSRFREWINSVDTVLEDMESNVPQFTS